MAVFCSLQVDCRPPTMETIKVEEYDPEMSCNSGSTTPGEDIWSKFEMEDSESLYPTPPLSPGNKPGAIGTCDYWKMVDPIEELEKSNMDLVNQLSSWLPEQSVDITPLLDLDYEMSRSLIRFDAKGSSARPEEVEMTHPVPILKKSLIQDCMWSAYKKLLQKDSDKSNSSSKPTPPVKSIDNATASFAADGNQPSDCVDPTAVFPYPLSIAETRLDLNIAGTTTPSDSDEEIDVVTIATTIESDVKKHQVKRDLFQEKPKVYRRETTSYNSPEHDYAKPRVHQDYRFALKRSKFTSSSLQSPQTSLLKKRKLNDGGVSAEEVARRLKGLHPKSGALSTRLLNYRSRPSNHKGRAVASRSESLGSSLASSRSASDSEDCEKRVSHNVLERKRREDLRSAFFILRDHIPHISSKDRVAKVVILDESKNYILQLRDKNARLASEREQLTRRHRELSSRLRKLNLGLKY